MLEDLGIPEQVFSSCPRIAIFRYDRKSYGAKIVDEYLDFDKSFIVKELNLDIPRSYVTLIGEEYFNKFFASAFKLMSRPNCPHPLAVLNPLRKKLRKIKRKLLGINPNNPALGYYLCRLLNMIKDMWDAAKNNHLRFLVEQRMCRKDTEILFANHLL